jgi:hypothetical protein
VLRSPNSFENPKANEQGGHVETGKQSLIWRSGEAPDLLGCCLVSRF